MPVAGLMLNINICSVLIIACKHRRVPLGKPLQAYDCAAAWLRYLRCSSRSIVVSSVTRTLYKYRRYTGLFGERQVNVLCVFASLTYASPSRTHSRITNLCSPLPPWPLPYTSVRLIFSFGYNNWRRHPRGHHRLWGNTTILANLL